MDFKWDFDFFRRNVSLGIPAFILADHIVAIIVFIQRPDVRMAVIIALCIQDAVAALEIGRMCRTYHIDEKGITACWFGLFRKYYPWGTFCSVGKQIVFLGERTIDCIICSQIPLKIRKDGLIDKEWVGSHPVKVLEIELPEHQYEGFFQYYALWYNSEE